VDKNVQNPVSGVEKRREAFSRRGSRVDNATVGYEMLCIGIVGPRYLVVKCVFFV